MGNFKPSSVSVCLLCLLSFASKIYADDTNTGWVKLSKPDRHGVGDTGPYDYGVMGPPATDKIVSDAIKKVPSLPKGPFSPEWYSIKRNYSCPEWFDGAKFGIFMHWGLYSVPAYKSEWYEKHMYNAFLIWHSENYGPPEEFGYKDFIPKFRAEKWEPKKWAKLFKDSGARLVMPCAQHHDNFALWDSDVTKFNSADMGPMRDLVGELAQAVRAEGLKFAVSNHGIENFSFIRISQGKYEQLKAKDADLFDQKWSKFYNVADRSDKAMSEFLADWVNRNIELIDKYQPDILWFDNGVNLRVLDPLKLYVTAYYYNQAQRCGRQVSISTKYNAMAPSNNDMEQIGSILDFEKVSHRSPADILGIPWMVDDPIGSTWAYTKDMRVSKPGSIIRRLVDTVSKGGFYLLNISPMADGTIPQAQQDTLLEIGKWLNCNGEAIYDTTPWKMSNEGKLYFTTKSNTLFAISLDWPDKPIRIKSLLAETCGVESVHMLGVDKPLKFSQDQSGLKVEFPVEKPCNYAYVLKVEMLKE